MFLGQCLAAQVCNWWLSYIYHVVKTEIKLNRNLFIFPSTLFPFFLEPMFFLLEHIVVYTLDRVLLNSCRELRGQIPSLSAIFSIYIALRYLGTFIVFQCALMSPLLCPSG
jgi:hypothetical protein